MRIYIATHKKTELPTDVLYLPLHVGSVNSSITLDYLRDDFKDNISEKNATFCELTGLYWIWKNSNEDVVGLVHYRRFFVEKGKTNDDPYKNLISEKKINSILNTYDVIVPRKRNYYIETLYSHYSHTHYKEHLDKARKIIEFSYPMYINSFDKVMKKRSGYMFNMFIMPKEIVDDYCAWLFPILFELEKQIDISEYNQFQARLFGRVSEILFNVWLMENNFRLKEIPWKYIGNIDYKRKLYSFIRAKIFKKKFESSF